MSDHEGEGYAGGRRKKRNQAQLVVNSGSQNVTISNPPRVMPQSNAHLPHRLPNPPGANTNRFQVLDGDVPASMQNQGRPFWPRPRMPGRGKGSAVESGPLQSANSDIKSQTRTVLPVKFDLSKPPTDSHPLPISWGAFVATFGTNKNHARMRARLCLDDIGCKTDTCLKTPNSDGMKIEIWGEPEHVAQARTQLEDFTTAHKSKQKSIPEEPKKWAKIGAVDGRRAHRSDLELNSKNLAYNDQMSNTKLKHEAFMIWPRNEGFDEFQEYVESNCAALYKQKRSCKVTFETIPVQHINILASTEAEVLALHCRLTDIAAQIREQYTRLVKLSMVHAPAANLDQGCIQFSRDAKTQLHVPQLTVAAFTGDNYKKWDKICRRWNKHNQLLIQNKLDRALIVLQSTHRYVKMRVTFGELAFQKYKRRAGTKGDLEIEEFCESIANGRNEIEQIPLGYAAEGISEVVESLTKRELFMNPNDFYSAFFDFKMSPNSEKILRLEMEFKVRDDAGQSGEELEVCGQRWLEYTHAAADEALEISVVDLTRPGIQIHVRAVNGVEERHVNNRLLNFKANVQFKPHAKGIEGVPRRRAIYPHGYPELFRLTEIYTKRFHMLSCDGIFDIRRMELYDEQLKHASAMPIRSAWSAVYYYSAWETLMGLSSQQDPSTKPVAKSDHGLKLFFQKDLPRADMQDGLPKGFRVFMKEVSQLQDLLAEVLPVAEAFQGAPPQ